MFVHADVIDLAVAYVVKICQIAYRMVLPSYKLVFKPHSL